MYDSKERKTFAIKLIMQYESAIIKSIKHIIQKDRFCKQTKKTKTNLSIEKRLRSLRYAQRYLVKPPSMELVKIITLYTGVS